MEDAAIDGSPAFHEREKPVVDLGMGAIGSSLANISNKFARQAYNDTYAVLRESDEAGASGIFRDPTRRFGSGIRLVGPRSPPIRDKYAPIRLSRAFSPSRDSRIDILRDEDSRNFAKRPEVDWVLPSDDSEGQWKPAHSLLGGQRDIAEEDDPFDDDESLRPPMRGGPVPTPQGSRSDLDPFEDIPRHRNSFTEASGSRSVTVPLPALSRSDHLDLDIFLAPPLEGRQESGISLPRSLRSMQSGTTSDAEEGIVQHAQIGSHHRVSLISPVETACLPIKRSESFFRRMTAGGISSLLSRQVTSPQQQQQQLDIRDPAPLPTLWQVKSREDLSYLSTSLGVEALQPPQPSHGKGLSLSSLQSAKSMRNMVIMQREATISSIETEAVIETASPLLLETERPEGAGHHRHGLTMGTETPGSIVFNGAAFASPVRLPVPNAGPSRPTLDPSPPMEAESSPSPLLAPDRPPSTPTRQVPLPPTDSPVPSPLLSHRRPVRDVVNSINKRASATPLSLFSPESQYSPAPISPQTTGRSGSTTRPSTIYEAVRRSPLTVTNPDWGGGRPSSTSE